MSLARKEGAEAPEIVAQMCQVRERVRALFLNFKHTHTRVHAQTDRQMDR